MTLDLRGAPSIISFTIEFAIFLKPLLDEVNRGRAEPQGHGVKRKGVRGVGGGDKAVYSAKTIKPHRYKKCKPHSDQNLFILFMRSPQSMSGLVVN